jgi:hypothetical protein
MGCSENEKLENFFMNFGGVGRRREWVWRG